MSQTAITFAFEQWKAKEAVNGSRVVLDEFVLANVPGLDASKPIDRKEGMPAAGQIVHRQAVNKTGVVNNNAVVYSVTLGTEVGDFDFNWIGLVNKATNTVAMIVHAPMQRKVANRAGQQGNAITRSFVMEYDGAAKETAITTPAETWQIDFTARLGGIDEMQRLINRDHYGAGAFFGNGFLVAKAGAQYFVTAGTGYVGGLRAVLAANQNITVTTKPIKVWADVSLQGNVVSQWAGAVKFTVAATASDYTDSAGFKHCVFAVASIDAAGNITDLRPKGSLSDQAGNDAYLRKDDNLASLKDKSKSRGSLGLGTAATRNVGVDGGNLMAVGAFGLGGGARAFEDAYCNTAQIYRVNASSANKPPINGNIAAGVISLPCDAAPSSGYVAVSGLGHGFIGYSNKPDNGVKWARIYTDAYKPTAQDVDAVSATQGGTFQKEIQASGGVMVANSWKAKPGGLFPGNGDGASYETCNVDIKSWYGLGFYNTCKEGVQGRTAFLNVRTGSFSAKGRITGASVWDGNARVYSPANKPTAADVGALTDAQAAQKYALRSIRVNGKALTGDVNLVASDVNAWTKTEADGRYVKLAGDKMKGRLEIEGSTVLPVQPLRAATDSPTLWKHGISLSTLEFDDPNIKDYPSKPYSTLVNFSATEHRGFQLLAEKTSNSYWLRATDSGKYSDFVSLYHTGNRPSASDVQAADVRNSFAARMGVARVLTGANAPTSPGVWSVENSSWAGVPWGSVLCTTNMNDLSATPGNGKFQHYLQMSHEAGGKAGLRVAANINGTFSGWDRVMMASGGSFTGPVSSNSSITAASLTASYHSVPSGVPPEGSGAFSAQLDTKAPFYQENYNWDVAEGGRYVPLVKGKSTRKGQGYPTAVSFGYLLDGKGSFAKPCIHVKGDNNAEALWQFDPNNKQFIAPGNLNAGEAVYQNDGNVKGSIWGGYLSTWLNNQLNARDNNINNRVDWGTYNRDVGARATIDWVNQNFIQNVRYSAEAQHGATGIYTYHENTVLTGFNNWDGDYSTEEMFWSYIQIYKNGQWITIGR
ncbi:Tail fiber protein [Serratia proteamaculans]|uniref:phage tail-collar fiber domain-containing protein n=1 Tax=Serratia proteamaculans TaxID=28151 RepID=UPI00217A0C87|nr:Tail fiber protein [Serratia proteamaculans]